IGDADRFGGVNRAGPSVRDGAVRARTRAHVAEDHEGRGAVVPALADIRTLRLLAHRMEVELAHQPLQPKVAWRSRRAHLEPVRLCQPRLRRRPVNHSSPKPYYI